MSMAARVRAVSRGAGAGGAGPAGSGAARGRGFTLLECLVAFTALGLILGAAYAALGAGARGAEAAATRLEALARVEGALASAAAFPPPAPVEMREGPWTLRVSAARWPEADGLIRVEVEALWRVGARPRSLKLATLAPAPPGTGPGGAP